MWLEQTKNLVSYEWGLAGPNGASFTLYPIKDHHTKEDVEEAKRELYKERDVVSIRIEWKSSKWFEKEEIRYL